RKIAAPTPRPAPPLPLPVPNVGGWAWADAGVATESATNDRNATRHGTRRALRIAGPPMRFRARQCAPDGGATQGSYLKAPAAGSGAPRIGAGSSRVRARSTLGRRPSTPLPDVRGSWR